MRPRLRHLAAVSLIACSLAGPLAAVVQQRACRMMGMHHDGRASCWCGQMSGYAVTYASQAALPGVSLATPRAGPLPLARDHGATQPLPDSPDFPPSPPPPNERQA